MLNLVMGLAVASEIKVLGWSDNERYVAIRTITHVTTETVTTGAKCNADEEEYFSDTPTLPKYPSNMVIRCTETMVFCPEYISPESETPFSGDLKITIYEVQEQQINLRTFLKLVPVTQPHVIYEAGTFISTRLDEGGAPEEIPGKCTSHAVAAKELKRAKSALKQYQINRQSTGDSVPFEQIIHAEEKQNSDSNDAIGYSIGRSIPNTPTDSTEMSTLNTFSLKGELTYLIDMENNTIDGMDIMTLGWIKLYEGYVDNILDVSGEQNLLNAAPFQSVHTPAWAGDSQYKLHSVLLSPSGNLVIFAQENSVSGYWGNYHTEELTFPILIKTDD